MAEAEHPADILERYTPIVKAAGMWSPKLDVYNVFMLGTAILKDTEVFKRRMGGDPVPALQAMSVREIEALQMRIMNKYRKNVKEE